MMKTEKSLLQKLSDAVKSLLGKSNPEQLTVTSNLCIARDNGKFLLYAPFTKESKKETEKILRDSDLKIIEVSYGANHNGDGVFKVQLPFATLISQAKTTEAKIQLLTDVLDMMLNSEA